MFRKLTCFLLTFILSYQLTLAYDLPDISADGAILIDAKTNSILYAKNRNLKFYPASTTKILTSLAILNDMDLNQIITKTQDAVNNVPSDSSQIGLQVGDQYTVYDGLHAVLMESDNFVCYDLAKADKGSITAFANEMNSLAFQSGADYFNFINPHGYHDINHYSSPFSLAYIGIAAFSNPILEEIAGTYKYNFTVSNTGRTIPLTHTAALLNPNSTYYNSNVVAVKTGFHDAAKRTLVAKAVYGDMELIGVVMRTDAPLQFEDMNKLFEYGSENFSITKTEENEYTLVNHSYSPWAEAYIKEAIKNGWISLHSTHNYLTPVSQREFINLLRCISPSEYSELLLNMVNFEGPSIYVENERITKAELAELIYSYLSNFNLITVTDTPVINDISELSSKTQEAINFCVTANILTTANNNFNPNSTVTYEEAICYTSRINQIITRYESFHL